MPASDIQQIAVIGLGTIGHGMAQAFAMAGRSVRAFDGSSQARESAADRIRSSLEQMHQGGIELRDSIDVIVARVQVVDSDEEAVSDSQFVSEAIQEDLSVKQQVFKRIETFVSDSTILASNTSSFPMTQISQDMKRPERAIVTHPFNPPQIVPVVEIVPGTKTDPAVVDATIDLYNDIGKVPVRLKKELPGFLINRIQVAMIREVWDMLEQDVASKEDIDRAVQGSLGFRLAALGPLEVCDFGGLDIWSKVYEILAQDIRSDRELPNVVREVVEGGNFGPKTGQGFYDYGPERLPQRIKERDRRYLELRRLFYS